jgi:protein TonB
MKNTTNSWLAFLLLFLSHHFAIAQSDSTAVIRGENHYDQIFVSVEEMPEFPGGMDSLFLFLGSEIQYPTEAKEKNIQGIVYVYFVIEKDGSVSGAEVKRGVKDAPMLDAEALRAVKAFPQWKPGKQNGKNARVAYTVPVKFFLQDKQKK